jgi:hypothetical protein
MAARESREGGMADQDGRGGRPRLCAHAGPQWSGSDRNWPFRPRVHDRLPGMLAAAAMVRSSHDRASNCAGSMGADHVMMYDCGHKTGNWA